MYDCCGETELGHLKKLVHCRRRPRTHRSRVHSIRSSYLDTRDPGKSVVRASEILDNGPRRRHYSLSDCSESSFLRRNSLQKITVVGMGESGVRGNALFFSPSSILLAESHQPKTHVQQRQTLRPTPPTPDGGIFGLCFSLRYLTPSVRSEHASALRACMNQDFLV